MEANGTVVVVSPDGRRLKTESLKYDNGANTISTNVHFTFDRGERAPGRQQLPLRPGLPERGHRPAARDGRRRDCCCRGRRSRVRRSGVRPVGLRLPSARRSPLSAQVPAQPPPKPRRRSRPPRPPAAEAGAPAGSRRRSTAGQRCTFQIDNVDRQGAVNETPAGHQLLRGRQRAAQLPRHADHDGRATASRPTAGTSSSSSGT